MIQNRDAEGFERHTGDILIETIDEKPSASVQKEAQKLSVRDLEKRILELTSLTYIIAFATGIVTSTVYPNLYYIKDKLHLGSVEYINFRSLGGIAWSIKPIIGYIEDVLAPFHYRIKFWILLASVLSATTSITIFFMHPNIFTFTVMFAIVNTAAVMHDVIAQGLTVIILNLHKTLAETQARVDDKNTTEVLLEGEKGTSEGKKAYGNYVMTRFIIRTTSTFLGGILAKILPVQYFFGAIGAVQILIIFYVLIFIREERRPDIISKDFSFVNNIKSFWQAISGKDTLLPIVLMILITACPDIKDSGTYILSDLMKWSPLTLSSSTMVAGVFYYIFMLYAINHAKNLQFPVQIFIASTANALGNLLFFRFIFYEEFADWSMYILTILTSFCTNLTVDFILIPIVARFSARCPKGIEAFGVTTIAALLNFSGTLSGIFGSFLLKVFSVTQDNYDNLYLPVTVVFGLGILVLTITPLFGK